jgi:DNA-binding response OmpR family regulator
MSKILILDDDLDLLTVVKSLLNNKGFEVTAFTDWKKAWESIKTCKPHLILLDVFLKGIDGLDICRKLKTFYSTRNIPVIMFSSYPNIAETAIYEYGADEFIQKPFEVNVLIRKMNGILARRRHSFSVKSDLLLRNFLQK